WGGGRTQRYHGNGHKASYPCHYIITFLTGLPSNLLAGYAFLRKVRQKATPMDVFLLNLTISDLILLLILPFKMAEASSDVPWPLPAFLCPLTNFCFYSSIYSSTLFLTGVSIERYLCIAYPIKFKSERRPTYVIVASLFFWFLACFHCSIIYTVQYHPEAQPMSHNSTCYESFSNGQLKILLPVRLQLCILLFFLPFIITLFCYIRVIRILTSLPHIKPQRKKRAVGLAVATLLNFAVCFGPFNISHLVGYIQFWSPEWRVYGFLLSSFNSTLDPVIFYFSSTAIQQTFAHCWEATHCKLLTLASRWSLPCCRTAGEPNKEAGAGGISTSGELAGAAIPTEASFVQTARACEIRALSPQQVQVLHTGLLGYTEAILHCPDLQEYKEQNGADTNLPDGSDLS
uniref:Free fatty acid receptor 2-like n=1 Tax=Podarcis muralis TaxID=64176 RepID=A0A670IIZ6_PODMU